MNKIFATCILLAAIFFSSSALASTHFLLQAGANQGLVSAGLAGEHKYASWGISYGISPSASTEDFISQINLEAAGMVYRGDEISFLMGPALLINASDKTFFNLPDKYPDGYYPPNAYFFALHASLAAKNGFFVEVSMLDYYFEVLMRNPRGSITNSGSISLGVGKIF